METPLLLSSPTAVSRLKTGEKSGLLALSFVIVAFGQPAWSDWLGLLTAVVGFAIFWRVLLDIPKAKKRFFLAMGWCTGIQLIQLSWFFSHPYFYIYGVTLLCSLLIGLQWGVLAIWIRVKNFNDLFRLLALAGFWTILEWSRLFLLSGLPFNPVGLTLTSALYPMQLASIGGVYGLSFWVILTNLLLLRAWILTARGIGQWIAVSCVAFFPYAFGLGHFYLHEKSFTEDSRSLKVVLVQSALPIEENIGFQSAKEARQFVLDEWRHVLATLQKQRGRLIDLIVFPEYLVPYGTYHHIFPVEEIHQLFQELFGEILHAYPTKGSPYIDEFWTDQGTQWLTSNAYLAQTVANLFRAHVVIGLEDSHYENQHKAHAYSSAFHFIPESNQLPNHYEKRVLVPMGEYIPFSWCQKLAAKYGVTGSLTCGNSAKVFDGPVPFGASICYEEMYGHLMRENRMQGAELLVNLTNDGWYPQSRLPKQHFDHARLRTVENGIPLVRACNTGITGGVDSLGRIVGVLGDNPMQSQEVADSLYLDVPLYHYQTFYPKYGDLPIIILSCLFILIGMKRSKISNSR